MGKNQVCLLERWLLFRGSFFRGLSLSLPPPQKLLIDEKPCYMFGGAKDVCDFPLPHQSCSRQHAALVYHKHLHRPFLIDLGSSE